jgi:hypothetical protein
MAIDKNHAKKYCKNIFLEIHICLTQMKNAKNVLFL